MAAKDANDTRRGERAVTDLQQRRLDQRKNGLKPVCGAPLVGSHMPGHANYNKGKTCKQPAGFGTDHRGYGNCSRHAGNMPSNKVGAARERAHETVEKERDRMAFLGTRIEIGFEEALIEELQRSVGIVRWLESILGNWGASEEEMTKAGYKWSNTDTGLPPLNRDIVTFKAIAVVDTEYAAWLREYNLQRKHLAAVAYDGIKAGIAKSMVVIYQQQADAMHKIVRRTLEALGVAEDDRLPALLPMITRQVAAEMKQTAGLGAGA